MTAYHGQQGIKDKFVALAEYHRKADQIAQGSYWEPDGTETTIANGVSMTIPNGKGCCVGCLHHSDNHRELANELGMPEWVVHLADSIHEGLSLDEAKQWPSRFVTAIVPGQDYKYLWNHFAIFVCEAVRPHAENETIIENVVQLHNRVLSGDEPEAYEWAAARQATWAAARAADRAAARATSRQATWAAARAADRAADRAAARQATWAAAREAAREAARQATWAAARQATWEKIADKLIELLEGVPDKVAPAAVESGE